MNQPQRNQKQITPQEKRALALVDYLIHSNERQARSLLYNAGYASPNSPRQMRAYFMDWLSKDKKKALETIMRQHPDKNLLNWVNEMDAKPPWDKELPSVYSQPSDSYFDYLRYNQVYPYMPQVLQQNAYPRSADEAYRSGIVSGRAYFGGEPTSKEIDIKNLVLVVIVMIVIYAYLTNK